MKLGQNACLGNCSDEFDWSGEQSRAIIALLFKSQTKEIIYNVIVNLLK
jgi:hypothetical protein